MKSKTTLFLQALIILIAIGTFAFLLGEPHLEGRNINATVFEIYFKDPFLAYVYIASIAFFTLLYQAFKVLNYVRADMTFSQATVKAVRIIKHSAMALIGFIAAAEVYIFIAVRGTDDIAGGVAMGLAMILISLIIAVAAAVFEKRLRSGVDVKSKTV